MKQYRKKETKYYGTFRDFLEEAAGKYGSAAAVTTYDRTGAAVEHSYTELCSDAFSCGRALYRKGFSGKHIAILGENSYEWLIAWLGIVVAGATAICIDIEQPDDIITGMVKRADAAAAICSKSLLRLCETIKSESELLESVIVFGNEGNSFEQLLENGKTGDDEELFVKCDQRSEQIADIVYTSGTTSEAKPVMLSQQAILTNAADSLTLLDSRDRVFNSLPLYHTYGLTCGMFCGLMRGLNVCISCDMKRMMRDMTLFKPGMLVAVPLIIEVLHKQIWNIINTSRCEQKIRNQIRLETLLRRSGSFVPQTVKSLFAGTCMENLNMILAGGACLDPLIADGLSHFGIAVLPGYGATECSPSISCTPNEDAGIDSVGHILPHNEVMIAEDGEILVRGMALMSGYYKEPLLTEESFEDGWFKTGDLGYLDKKGLLHLTGRKKNLIVMKNGNKVSAEEMENMMRQLPLIKDVMVYGAQSGISADDVRIAASIYPDPAATEGMSSYEVLEELQSSVDEMNRKLPIYKQVRMLTIREKDFERTASSKIKRQII